MTLLRALVRKRNRRYSPWLNSQNGSWLSAVAFIKTDSLNGCRRICQTREDNGSQTGDLGFGGAVLLYDAPNSEKHFGVRTFLVNEANWVGIDSRGPQRYRPVFMFLPHMKLRIFIRGASNSSRG
jgi:hypothetical protein